MYIDIACVYFYSLSYEIGEKLRCDREENDPNDKFAVKLVRNDGNKEQCVGHVLIEHSKVFKFFLKRGGKIFATVTGNKFFNIGTSFTANLSFALFSSLSH
jgi:hypothetical protein